MQMVPAITTDIEKNGELTMKKAINKRKSRNGLLSY